MINRKSGQHVKTDGNGSREMEILGKNLKQKC